MIKHLIIFIFLFFLFFASSHLAKELQIYADYIDYDSNKNLVVKGNVKLIQEDEIITRL